MHFRARAVRQFVRLASQLRVHGDIHDDRDRVHVCDDALIGDVAVSTKPVGFAFGVAFGFMLGWARLTDYDVIRDMLLLRQPDVFLLMMSAIATAAVALRVLRARRVLTVLDRTPLEWRTQAPQGRHVAGSVLFGIGWSLAGTCPGPVAAQLGRGQLAAVFTIAGVLTGILIHDQIQAWRTSNRTQTALRETGAVAGL